MFERIILTQINPHVYLMDDAHEATGHLVVGSERALVIDTMNGFEDVHAVVRSITDLPVMVVNTHGHCDHIFGNVYFDKAYIHAQDLPLAQEHMRFPEFVAECEKRNLKMPPFEFVTGGDVFDLGNLHVRVIELPGHTPGGILLLLEEDRILFTGDSINRHLWMQLPESLPIKDMVEELDKIMPLKAEADYILHGHARGLEDISLMEKMLQGLKDILAGKTEDDQPYKWFAGVAKQHPFDTDSVICYKEQN